MTRAKLRARMQLDARATRSARSQAASEVTTVNRTRFLYGASRLSFHDLMTCAIVPTPAPRLLSPGQTFPRSSNSTRQFWVSSFGFHRGADTSHFQVQSDWTQKMWCLRTKDCHSALRKDGTLPVGTTWMGFEIITLSEISRTEKTENRVISLTCGTYDWKRQPNKTNQNPQTWTTV